MKHLTKQERHAAIRERAANALRDMYHNATPTYPRDVPENMSDEFQAWFEHIVEFEIEYLEDGGAYGRNYEKTLNANCNAGQFKSDAARRYYVRKGMREMRRERERCNDRDSRTYPLTNALWERITEFGKLYTYGRGGRTLAPDGLVKTFVREDAFAECSITDCVEGLRIVESFNAYVASWCKSVPEMWREHFAEIQAEEDEATARAIEASRPDMYPVA